MTAEPAQAHPQDYRLLLARHGRTYWWTAGVRRIVWAMLGDVQGRLLDVGCGPGWTLFELPPGVWGAGLDRGMLGIAAAMPPGHQPPFTHGDALRLPFPARTFDTVLSLDLLEQRGVNAPGVLADLHRVLVPGGRLLVRVPAHPSLMGPHDSFFGGERRYRKNELAWMVAGAGFRIRRLSYAVSILFPAGALQRLLGRFGLAGENDMAPVSPPVNRLLLRTLELEARWLRRRDLPVGLSLLCLAERPALT